MNVADLTVLKPVVLEQKQNDVEGMATTMLQTVKKLDVKKGKDNNDLKLHQIILICLTLNFLSVNLDPLPAVSHVDIVRKHLDNINDEQEDALAKFLLNQNETISEASSVHQTDVNTPLTNIIDQEDAVTQASSSRDDHNKLMIEDQLIARNILVDDLMKLKSVQSDEFNQKLIDSNPIGQSFSFSTKVSNKKVNAAMRDKVNQRAITKNAISKTKDSGNKQLIDDLVKLKSVQSDEFNQKLNDSNPIGQSFSFSRKVSNTKVNAAMRDKVNQPAITKDVVSVTITEEEARIAKEEARIAEEARKAEE